MSKIIIEAKDINVKIIGENNEELFAYEIPEYHLSANPKGLVKFIGEFVKEVKAWSTQLTLSDDL